jgi:Mg2+/Co2+ transporter CorB
LLLSAFFSGSETALMTLNRYRLRHLVKQKNRSAIKTNNLLKRPDRLIGLILLGNNFVNNFAASIATVIAIRVGGGGEEAIAIATAILTLAVLIFSEVTPKTLGALRPDGLAYAASWVYTPLLKLLYPLVWMVSSVSNLLLRLFGIYVARGKTDGISKEELRSIVSEAEHLMPSRYQNMLLSILDMESASVDDIMTPRHEIYGLDLEASVEVIIKQLQHSPYTRLPVYRKNIDRVIGFLDVRKVLPKTGDADFDKQIISDHLIKPFFIPASTSLHKQMQSFKTEKLRMGLIVDEYGDVQGLVTLDDLLQEIVGELLTDDADIQLQKDGSYLVDGQVTVRELNRVMHWNLPTEGPKTLNGLIVDFMETIPEAGTSVRLHGYPLEIVKCDENTVKLVKFYPPKQ